MVSLLALRNTSGNVAASDSEGCAVRHSKNGPACAASSKDYREHAAEARSSGLSIVMSLIRQKNRLSPAHLNANTGRPRPILRQTRRFACVNNAGDALMWHQAEAIEHSVIEGVLR
jgi:hypothetical protein